MNINEAICSVNEFARRYDDYVRNCQWIGPDILFGLLYEYIHADQTLLDLGIGTGLSSALFKKAGLSVYGIDASEEMIKTCRDKGIAEELQLADLTKNDMWFENKAFDHVISHGVFHLIGDIRPIFKQISEILKTGGCFCFTYESVHDMMDDYRNSDSGITVFRHSDEFIFGIMKANGFRILKNTEFIAFIDKNTNAKRISA